MNNLEELNEKLKKLIIENAVMGERIRIMKDIEKLPTAKEIWNVIEDIVNPK